ncbi:hypothetical protein [Marinisporobacter balticus]|uniref:Rubrerythrin n=1 Tax=Marinisporobacter balticus TaxID=2018667 RepID=A0A4R2KM58_9FIRM|nr:hypothetical protein [Marinisporobacter balticus]TCO74773.1 hypothetical protein EV214_11135 [Marinisporobacter balticus]
MAYNIIDLMNKIILVAKKRKEMYEKIRFSTSRTMKVSVVATILVKDVQKTIDYYEQLKIEIEKDEEEIDFFIYDKISFLINTFQRRFISPDIQDTEELLKFSLDFEKQVVALYIDIQGRIIQKEEDHKTKTYKILCEIIEKKQNHIKNLQKFIKK